MRVTQHLRVRLLIPFVTALVVLAACSPTDANSPASLAEQDRAQATERARATEAEPLETAAPGAPAANLPAGDATDDRPGVLAYLGRPDAFTISVVWVDGAPVKMETWRYYQFGTRVDFVDGAAVWTIEIEPMPDGTIFAAWYDPLTFNIGMTEAEASAAIAAASPAGLRPTRLPLEEGGTELAGGVALVGDQIMIGLADDQIVYVETVALVGEDGEG